MMDWEKSFVEWVRKNQLVLRSMQRAIQKSPKAPKLDQPSRELHQVEVHVIKELIQKADDNNYGENDCPTLKFLFTDEDIAEVGAPATLLILNNDVGVDTRDITALCSFATSSKRGTWLNSVFTVCETPIIISNGFRIRFRLEACDEIGEGCIVPEWTESPTDAKILSTCGSPEQPTTIILLPIEDDKVDVVLEQLEHICPEVILFLSSIRVLGRVNKTVKRKKSSDFGDFMEVIRSEPLSAIETRVCKFSKVTLSVATGKDNHTYYYLIFQRRFPVTPSLQERQEIREWVITLAFPQDTRASFGEVGEVFSLLPTGLKTGFPFILNADFTLISSTKIQLDSAWNASILNCIPIAFHIAFEIMLQKPVSTIIEADGITETWPTASTNHLHWFETYKFLPCNEVGKEYTCSSSEVEKSRRVRRKLHVQPYQVPNLQQLEKVRREIFHRLDKEYEILQSAYSIGSPSKYQRSTWFPAKSCMQIKVEFLSILEKAARSNHPARAVMLELGDDAPSPTAKFVIVDYFIEWVSPSALTALGVPEMTNAQYESFLVDDRWLLSLPDEIYVELLSFFAFQTNLLQQSETRYSSVRDTVRILKVIGQNSHVELATFSELSVGTEFLYVSSAVDSQWTLEWVMEFSPWDSAKVMPIETSKALVEASNSAKLKAWIKRHGSLAELTAQKYSDTLIEKLKAVTVKSEEFESTGIFPVLVLQFLYSGIRAGHLDWQATVDKIRTLDKICVVDHVYSLELCASRKLREEGGILLPPKVSRWSRFFPSPRSDEQRLIVLSDKYLDPHCPLVKDIMTSSRGLDSMLEFIKQSFNAGDIAY